MNLTRRNFIVGGLSAGAAATVLPGCKHVPSVESMTLIAEGFGCSAGLVLNECDLPEGCRASIVEIVKKVLPLVPAKGQSIEEAWTPVAQALVDQMIADKKIDVALGAVIMAGFQLVVRGFALLEKRYPAILDSRELLEAAVTGFGTGLLATLNPNEACESCSVDLKAVKELRSSVQFRTVRAEAARVRIRERAEARKDRR